MFINYYEILGIVSTSNEEQIKRAYRQQAIRFHPDKHFGDPFFANKFLEIKTAYDNLIDPQKRSEFDREYSKRNTDAVKESNSSNNKESTTSESPKENEKKGNDRAEEKRKAQEKFRYDPYKQFYSDYDRELQETPQFNPIGLTI